MNKKVEEMKTCPKCGQKTIVKKIVFENDEWVFKKECENPCCKDMEYGLL